MLKEALVDHIFVRLEPQIQDYVEVKNPDTTAWLLEVLARFEERCSCKKMQGSRNRDNVERRGWNSIGCLLMTINGGNGEIRKFYIDRVITEIIIGAITRLVVKEINGLKARMDLIGMIEDLIKDTSRGIEFKVKILVEGTAEIGGL
ncbi:uncharacterized protein TNCV_4467411 [Trichonephila clavipes]|nr:uncharacterized protein TNCV_4467411 [Trichonephila clavipes]